jgi:hypothetical protein
MRRRLVLSLSFDYPLGRILCAALLTTPTVNMSTFVVSVDVLAA